MDEIKRRLGEKGLIVEESEISPICQELGVDPNNLSEPDIEAIVGIIESNKSKGGNLTTSEKSGISKKSKVSKVKPLPVVENNRAKEEEAIILEIFQAESDKNADVLANKVVEIIQGTNRKALERIATRLVADSGEEDLDSFRQEIQLSAGSFFGNRE
jgi:hypothetical protein